MSTDVLFIHPGNHKRNYQELSKEYTAVATPVWTLLSASHLLSKGKSAEIYDVNVHGWDKEVAGELIDRHHPKLVVLMVYGHNPSASTQTMPAARMIATDLKAREAELPIAFGGIHPSALPERTLREEPIDFVLVGEGPKTIVSLLEALEGKLSLSEVKGLAYAKGDDFILNEPAGLIADLDVELPSYPFHLLGPLSAYRAHNMHCFADFEKSRTSDFSDVRSPYAVINTSLGCPYSCSYCCINTIFGKPGVRCWSLEKVADWLTDLKNIHGVRNVRFDDELFILNPKRLERFCDLLIERNLDLNIWVYGRVDTIKPHLLKKLKKAGVSWVCLGIESGSEAVRTSVNKKIGADIEGVVKAIQESGISVLGNYMFGLPEDTLSSMEETLRLATKLNCEYANFYTVMPHPGSKLYEWALEKEGALPESWEGYAQLGYNTQPLPTKYLNAAQVLRFRDEAFLRYHENKDYLSMMGSKFGAKVVTHIEQMMEIKLKRKLLGQ